MTKPKQSKALVRILVTTLLVFGYLLPTGGQLAFAGTEYKLLQPIPSKAGSQDTEVTTAGEYLKGLFNLAIAIAGVLAVIQIILGGIQYMSTDAFGAKSEAKNTIQNAIWGLALALSAWLILYTINPNLITFNFNFPNAQQQKEVNNNPS